MPPAVAHPAGQGVFDSLQSEMIEALQRESLVDKHLMDNYKAELITIRDRLSTSVSTTLNMEMEMVATASPRPTRPQRRQSA